MGVRRISREKFFQSLSLRFLAWQRTVQSMEGDHPQESFALLHGHTVLGESPDAHESACAGDGPRHVRGQWQRHHV